MYDPQKDFTAIAREMNEHAFDAIHEQVLQHWREYVSRSDVSELIKALDESTFSYDTSKMMAWHLKLMTQKEEAA